MALNFIVVIVKKKGLLVFCCGFMFGFEKRFVMREQLEKRKAAYQEAHTIFFHLARAGRITEEHEKAFLKEQESFAHFIEEIFRRALEAMAENYEDSFACLHDCFRINKTLGTRGSSSLFDISAFLQPNVAASLIQYWNDRDKRPQDRRAPPKVFDQSLLVRKKYKVDSDLRNRLDHLVSVTRAKGFEGTANYLSKLVSIMDAIDSHFRLVELINSATSFAEQGEFQKALKLSNEALEIYERNQSVFRVIDRMGVLINIAAIYDSLTEFDRAIELYEVVECVLADIKEDTDEVRRAKGCHKLDWGSTLKSQQCYGQALEKFHEAEKLFVAASDKAQCYNNIGTVYRRMKKPSKALSEYMKVKKLFDDGYIKRDSLDSHKLYANCLSNAANVLVEMGGTTNAKMGIKLSSESIRFYKEHAPDHPNFAELKHSIGNFHRILGQHEECFDYLRQAIDCSYDLSFQKNKYRRYLSEYLWEHGERIKTDDPDRAAEFHESAINELKTVYENNVKLIRGNGNVDFDFDRYDFFDCAGHTKVLEDLASYEKKLGKSADSIRRYQRAGELMKSKDRLLIALIYFEKGRSLAKEFDDGVAEKEFSSKIAQVHHDMGQEHHDMGHEYHARELRLSLGETVSAIAMSPHHQLLETLHVEFVNMLMDYHCHLGGEEGRDLTKEDENRAGSFFVGFLNLLDQIYSHWIHSIKPGAGHVYFPDYTSRVAMEKKAIEERVWAGVIQAAGKEPVRLGKDIKGVLGRARYIGAGQTWTRKAKDAFDAGFVEIGVLDDRRWLNKLTVQEGQPIGLTPQSFAWNYLNPILVQVGCCQWMKLQLFGSAKDLFAGVTEADFLSHLQPEEHVHGSVLFEAIGEALSILGDSTELWASQMELISEVTGLRVLELISACKPTCSWDQDLVQVVNPVIPEVNFLTAVVANPLCEGEEAGQIYTPGMKQALGLLLLPELENYLNQANAAINTDSNTFGAFERTQAYAYHRRSALSEVGVEWGLWAHILGNTNKHIKLTTQTAHERVMRRPFGTFQRLRTTIEIELPVTRLTSWSFESIVGSPVCSRGLFRRLKKEGVIDKRQVAPAHAWFNQLLREYVQDEQRGLRLGQQQVEACVMSLGLGLSDVQQRQVSAFLVDQALMVSGLRVESVQGVSMISMVEQAFCDVGKWLNRIHGINRPLLERIGYKHEPMQNLVSLPQVLANTRPFGEDIEKQIGDCERLQDWLNNPIDRLVTEGLRKYRVTQLLVKIRGLLEQTFGRFAARCVRWPNKPIEFPIFAQNDIKSIFTSSTVESMREHLDDIGLRNTPVGKVSLNQYFPDLLQSLESFWTNADKFARINRLIPWTNNLKHSATLDAQSWDRPEGAEVRTGRGTPWFNLRDFVQDVFNDIKTFSELCITKYREWEGLFSVAKNGGELPSVPEGGSLTAQYFFSRLDKAGNSVLHFIAERQDQEQLDALKARLSEEEFASLAAVQNHRGETADLSFAP